MEPGLRERKKRDTRRRIAGVASRMFIDRGFDAVTVAEVAAAAGVSKMTVFNYFPRKEDLFLDRIADRVADVARAVTERAAGETPSGALRCYHHGLLAARHPLSGAIEGTRGFWQIVASSPALVGRMHEVGWEVQDALARVLIDEYGPGGEQRARLTAALLAAADVLVYETAVRRIVAGDDVERVRREQAAVVDEAFDVVERGLGGPGAR